MAEQLFFRSEDKITRYAELRPQLEALIGSETDAVANMANFCAALKEAFGWFWIGFYIVREEQLVLGPFQGPIACTRIQYGKGVCGTAWAVACTWGSGSARAWRSGAFRPGAEPGYFCQAALSAACRVLTSSMVMVMGPTPPGTGVM